MKKAAFALLFLAWPAAAQTSTVFNPFTGKPDYVNTGTTISTNTINNSPQFRATYYSAPGSSATLSGFDGMTVSTTTGVAISTVTATTGTITTLNSQVATFHGTGAGQIALRHGLESTVRNAGRGAFVLWADTVTQSARFDTDGISTYSVVGTSAPTSVNHCAKWTNQFALVDAGADCSIERYQVEPSTITFALDLGILVSTAVFTSTVSIPYVAYTVFSNISTATLDTAFLDVSGSTSAFGPVKLGGSYGTSGQAFTSGGSGGRPSWTTISGGSGGSSSMQTTQSGVEITSPTSSMNFAGPPFILGATGSTTTVKIDGSTATLHGAITASPGQLFYNSAKTFAGVPNSVVTPSSVTLYEPIQADTITARNFIKVGGGGLRGSNPTIDLARTIGVEGGHGFQDSSVITGNATTGYSPFSNFTVMNGVGPYEHHSGFQSAESYNSTSTITYIYDFISTAGYDNSGGSSNHYSFRANSPTINSTGRPVNYYGFFVPTTPTAGSSTNFGIYSATKLNHMYGLALGLQDDVYPTSSAGQLFIGADKIDAITRYYMKDNNTWSVGATSGTANFVIKDVNGAEYFSIQGNSGNIGVNNSTPTRKMDIVGGLLVSSTATISSLSASLPVQTDATKTLTSAAIDLSGTQATGTMAAGREPAHTGDVTNTAGSLAMTAAARQSNITTVAASSLTVAGASGLKVDIGIATTKDYTAATCQSGTASLGFSAFTTSSAVANCQISTSTVQGVASFVDNSTMSVQGHFPLTSDWTGAVNANIVWNSSITANDVVWKIRTGCVANAESMAVTWNAFTTVTDTAQAIASQKNEATISTISVTSCAAGEEFYWEFVRDPANAADTLASTANLVTLQFVIRRTLTL